MKIDTSKLFEPLPRRVKATLLATSAAVAMTGAIAHAQENDTGPRAQLKFRSDYFGYGLSVGPRVTYTDNITLASGAGKEDEIAVTVGANGAAIYSTNRLAAIFDGSLDLSYLVDAGKVVASQDVGGVATATISDNLLYVDVAGSSSRQLAGANARFSRNINAGRNNRVNVHNFAVSPYLNHRFSDGSAAELRYRFSQVFMDGGTSRFGSNFNNDSMTQEAIASYNTGKKFDRLQIALTGYANRTNEDATSLLQEFKFEQASADADIQFAVTERFALTGAVGYDEIDTTAPAAFIPADQLSGFFWRAGFRARPGRRTNMRIEYGQRYDDDFINANISYDVTKKVTFSASAARTFQTRAQAVSTQFEALQRRTLDFVESIRASSKIDPNDPQAAEMLELETAEDIVNAMTRYNRSRFDAGTIGFGVANNASAGLSADYGRTTLGLNANYHDVDFGYRRMKSIGGALGATHDLSRRLTAFADVFYRYVDAPVEFASCFADPILFGVDPALVPDDATKTVVCNDLVASEGVTNTYGGRIGASYRLYQNVSAYGEFSHTERTAKNAFNEYGENTFTAGLQMDF